MSWKIINQIFGLAAVDKEFARKLLEEPVATIQAQGFILTPEEERVFRSISANNLQEFSQQLIQELQIDQG